MSSTSMIDYILLLLKEDREDWDENHGILRDIHAVSILHGRLLYYEHLFGFGGYDVIQNNDLSNVELEEELQWRLTNLEGIYNLIFCKSATYFTVVIR